MYYKPVTSITKYATDILDVSLPYINPDSTIIDVGCGSGSLLSLFRQEGFNNVTGIDTSNICVSHLQNQGIECMHGSLFTTDIHTQFDYVTCCHVLEHIIDINKFVDRIKQLVKPHGHVYIEVPDSARYTISPPFQDFNLEHVNHFNLVTLISLFDKHGFQCIKSGQKVVGKDYPSIYCIFTFKTDINDHLVASTAEFESILERIEKEFSKTEPLCLYGIGQFAYKLIPVLFEQGYNIKCLVDDSKFKHGKTINGLTITDSPSPGMRVIITATCSENMVKANNAWYIYK
jgi:SAM-dependent methyltransferase